VVEWSATRKLIFSIPERGSHSGETGASLTRELPSGGDCRQARVYRKRSEGGEQMFDEHEEHPYTESNFRSYYLP
jgi:hypothetical protein